MGKMWFDFETNLPNYDKDIPTVQVDYLAFRDKDKKISVSCNWESEFGVTNGVYSARFKGLETSIETLDGIPIKEWSEMTIDDFKALKNMELYEIGIYVPFGAYDGDIEAKNISVEIEMFLDKKQKRHKFNQKTVDVVTYGDD